MPLFQLLNIFFIFTYKVNGNHVLLNSIRMNPSDMGFVFDINYACDYPETSDTLYIDPRLEDAATEKVGELNDAECPLDHDTCPKNCYRYDSCTWTDRIFYYLGGETGSIAEVLAHNSYENEDVDFIKSYFESSTHCQVLISSTFRSIGSYTENGNNVMVFYDNMQSEITYYENTTCVSYNNNIYYLSLHHDYLNLPGFDSKFVVGPNNTFVYVFLDRNICFDNILSI